MEKTNEIVKIDVVAMTSVCQRFLDPLFKATSSETSPHHLSILKAAAVVILWLGETAVCHTSHATGLRSPTNWSELMGSL